MTRQPPSDGPIVDEVRDRATRISTRFGDDPRRYVEHLKAAQLANARRVVGQLTVTATTPKSQ